MPAYSMGLVSGLVHSGGPIEADLDLRIVDIRRLLDSLIKIGSSMNDLLMSIDREGGVFGGFDGSK